LNEFVDDQLSARANAFAALAENVELRAQIVAIAQRCIQSLRDGGKILFAGNGGSAGDAQHLAAELVSRFRYDRPGLPGIALTTDTSALTAIGNDYGFETLFSRQVQALGRSGDVLIAFSTSGKSPNIVAGLKTAQELGIVTIGFAGETGGDMVPHCDLIFRANSRDTALIQELHMTAGHIVCGLIEMAMFPRT
jgi:D-sedoheptulose 7-phosphate isomerase